MCVGCKVLRKVLVTFLRDALGKVLRELKGSCQPRSVTMCYRLSSNASTESMRIREAIIDLPPSPIARIAALGMGDPAVIPLWYGEGDLPTPAFIGAAASAALQAGHTFYTYKAGLPELRAAIAEYQSGLYARPSVAERIVVTSSGMTALMMVAEALIDVGDNLVIVAPVWPNIAAAVSIMGGEPRLVGLDPIPGGGWRLDLDRVLAACDARTSGIFVNSPSNPTGWVASAEEIAALLDTARRRPFSTRPSRTTG